MSRLDSTEWSPNGAAGFRPPQGVESHSHGLNDLTVNTDAWVAYTPTHNAITVGNGTEVARYSRIGRTVHVAYSLLFGSTTTIAASTVVQVGLPVLAKTHNGTTNLGAVGAAVFLDSDANDYSGVAWLVSQTQVRFQTHNAPSLSAVLSTAPFTWATGDVLMFSFTYEAAS